MARRADLRPELEELKRRRFPVTVIWASRDGIIPKESFEAMCTAVGTPGTVVEGSHSWLLADPGRFVEVITNDLQVALRCPRDGGPVEAGRGGLRCPAPALRPLAAQAAAGARRAGRRRPGLTGAVSRAVAAAGEARRSAGRPGGG